MLQVFSTNDYAFIDISAILSFVTPLVAMMFYMLPNVLVEPFSVLTPVGGYVVAKRVYSSCPILLSNRVKFIDFVEFCMFDFDVILGMNLYKFLFV